MSGYRVHAEIRDDSHFKTIKYPQESNKIDFLKMARLDLGPAKAGRWAGELCVGWLGKGKELGFNITMYPEPNKTFPLDFYGIHVR